MKTYKRTQIGYPILVVTFAVLCFFVWVRATAVAEPPSVDAGPNFLMTVVMGLILFILASFSFLTVVIDQDFLRIKFGYGVFRKKISLQDIASVVTVKNPWYAGWGIRLSLRPYLWMYTVSGFDAVQITLKNGKMYRIGTDVPQELEVAIKRSLSSLQKKI